MPRPRRPVSKRAARRRRHRLGDVTFDRHSDHAEVDHVPLAQPGTRGAPPLDGDRQPRVWRARSGPGELRPSARSHGELCRSHRTVDREAGPRGHGTRGDGREHGDPGPPHRRGDRGAHDASRARVRWCVDPGARSSPTRRPAGGSPRGPGSSSNALATRARAPPETSTPHSPSPHHVRDGRSVACGNAGGEQSGVEGFGTVSGRQGEGAGAGSGVGRTGFGCGVPTAS